MTTNIKDIAKTIGKLTGGFAPQIVLILGSGFGGYCDRVKAERTLSFSEIESFPRTSVAGHKGKLVFARHMGQDIAIMAGRVHYYEGFKMQDVVLPIRALRLLGARNLIVTNAAGGINEDFDKGDIMLIEDHISLFCPNPLIGKNYDEFGVRFPDMSRAYDRELGEVAKDCAKKIGLSLKRGIYCYLTGPSYETPADIRALMALGADCVGMSTVPEVICARHAGMRVCGFSYISNKGAGLSQEELSHEDVVAAFAGISDKFYALLDMLIERISDEKK
ncbi:MAG: purine-nucleoside phosphorylase [Clostridiales bacterium]|jgi:purine-nucleoside phosphorylase|nr:purine-nucleoside phosphorylase [Clostridiales bacterium]